MTKASKIHGRVAARNFAPVQMTASDVRQAAALQGVGIHIGNEWVQEVLTKSGVVGVMDAGNDVGPSPAMLSGLTTPSIANQVQFLQSWLPGFVHMITTARTIDNLVGMQTVGAWEDEEVVQGALELIGTARPYTDNGNIPLADWNATFERRTVVRFEHGLSVGRLEDARSARMRLDTAANKRAGVGNSLEIQRNRVGFYGYNNGEGRTFGFLNDPALSPYITLPQGAAGSSTWASKTFLEIIRDIRLGLAGLRKSSGGNINPKTTPITLALGLDSIDMLTVTGELGYSVGDWLKSNYPNVRAESAPELDGANGGANVMYLYADKLDDGSTDDGDVFAQLVPTKFLALGVEQRSKGYAEDFANATAGVMCKRPYAVARYTGL